MNLSEEDRCKSGYLYYANDSDLTKRRWYSRDLNAQYNAIRESDQEKRTAFLKRELCSCGENPTILSPFSCDFWEKLSLGDDFFANYNFVVLAGCCVEIGNSVWIAPNVGLYDAGHAFDPGLRQEGLEYALGITIGDHVWIGGHTCILSGVTIGENTIIGAGSVVTTSIPDGVLAAGNPCRVIRKITQEDDRRFLEKFHPGGLGKGLAGLRGDPQ